MIMCRVKGYSVSACGERNEKSSALVYDAIAVARGNRLHFLAIMGL